VSVTAESAATDGAASASVRAAQQAESLLLLALSRPDEAHDRAEALLANRPGARDEAIARQALGIVARYRGDLPGAFAHMRAAVRLAAGTGDGDRHADALATLGLTQVLSGRTTAGLGLLDQAARIASGAMRGQVLTRRGGILGVLGRHDAAFADLREAVTLLDRAGGPGDAVWAARARTHRGLAYLEVGQAARADEDFALAEEAFGGAGQELETAMAAHNRALVACGSGDLPTALRFLDDADARYRRLRVPMPELAVDRCGVLLAAGLADEAFAETVAAVRRLEAAGGQGAATQRAELLLATARAALVAGRPADAARPARLARDLFRRQGRERWEIRAALVLVRARHAAGESGAALLRAAGKVADRLAALRAAEVPEAQVLVAGIALGLGRRDEAERRLGRAAEYRFRGAALDRGVGWLAQALLADLADPSASGAGAVLRACGHGLAAIEAHQRTLGATELRAHATAHGAQLAGVAQRRALAGGDARRMLGWSERWRAVALATPPAATGDDPRLAEDLVALRGAHRRLAAAPDEPARARAEADCRRLEAAVRCRVRHAAGAPASVGGRLAATGTAPQLVAEVLAGLGEHRLVELVEVDGRLRIITVVGGRVRLHTAGAAADVDREVELATFLLRRLAYGRAPAGSSRRLSGTGAALQEALLGDAAELLADGDGPVVLVPPGRLHAVPWNLLPVLRDPAVTVAPSALTWLRAAATGPPEGGGVTLVFGPGLISEVDAIAASYDDPRVLAGEAATAEATLAALDGAWTAHIAAHGVFRADNPLLSALQLHDGPLTGYDLGRLRRAPYRLVLSSCESAVTAPAGADELIGLVSALLPLGTASLLASVVPVNDERTAGMMADFHGRLRTGAGFGAALAGIRAAACDDPVAAATAASFIALGR
jgi:tetratricopeptide (TPR) repeat protein